MTLTEKMDVLDLVIGALKDHERALDALVERMEKALGHLDEEARQRELQRRFWRDL